MTTAGQRKALPNRENTGLPIALLWRDNSRPWRWALLLSLCLAWLVMFAYGVSYQIGRLAGLFLSGAAVSKIPQGASTGKAMHWEKCDDIILCSTLEIPLSYNDPTAGVATLSVAKYPSASPPAERLGTLLFNPGGPGGSGVGAVYSHARNFSKLLDGRYDIVSWDPRGTNGSTPRIECFQSRTEQDIFYARTARESPLSIGNLSNPADLAIFTHQLQLEDARNAALVHLCVNRTGTRTLSNVGTATVARDLDLLASALEGDKPVNYWGFSYGSLIGSFFVNMFPERVGRIVIDGVMDPVAWTHRHSIDLAKFYHNSTQASYESFLSTCAKAGPRRCALATQNCSTSSEIRVKVDNLIADLYERPLPVPHARRPGALTKGHVVGFIFRMLYAPRKWAFAADCLSLAMRGDGGPILDVLQDDIHLNTTAAAPTLLNAYNAVTCTDAPPYSTDQRKKSVEEAVEAVQEAMEFAGPFGVLLLPDLCHLWPVEAEERFIGPFNASLANEIMIIGNTRDPVTPLINAQHLHSLLRDSTLVQQDGDGHMSIAQASLCTARLLRAYFLDGTLPPSKEVLCPVTEPPFLALGHESDFSAWQSENAEWEDEDIRLLEIMQGLGRHMERIGVPLSGIII